MEPQLAFYKRHPEPPGLEVRVNFGIFAGRPVTPAEIDELARYLLDEVGAVTIVAEDRHELDPMLETSVHMVRSAHSFSELKSFNICSASLIASWRDARTRVSTWSP